MELFVVHIYLELADGTTSLSLPGVPILAVFIRVEMFLQSVFLQILLVEIVGTTIATKEPAPWKCKANVIDCFLNQFERLPKFQHCGSSMHWFSLLAFLCTSSRCGCG